MDVEKLGIDVHIGDVVGGRDYLTGMYGAKPVEKYHLQYYGRSCVKRI